MKRIILTCLILLGLLTSCGIQSLTTDNNYGYVSIECFQALENYDHVSVCLAKDSDWNICYVVSLKNLCDNNNAEMFYDGKNISGNYVLVGTYQYESKGGSSKTVKALMRKDVYDCLYNNHKEHLINMLDIVLTYNLVK